MKPGRPTTLVAEARSSARSGRASRPRTRTRRSRSPEPRPRSRPSRFRRSPMRTPPRRRGGRRRRDRARRRGHPSRGHRAKHAPARAGPRRRQDLRRLLVLGSPVGVPALARPPGPLPPATTTRRRPRRRPPGRPRRPSPSRPRRDERVRVGGPAAAHPHRSSSYAPAALSRANRSSTTCGQLLTKPVASTAVTMSDGFLPVSNASGNGDARLIRLK